MSNRQPFGGNLNPRHYPKEECGIAGVYNHPFASNLVYLALHALQHRGQETTGIVSSDGHNLYRTTGMGTVNQVFTEEKIRKLPGDLAIGHNRYSTTGGSFLRNAQPLRAHSVLGPVSLAHNGNLINSWQLRRKMEEHGSIFQTSIDSEVIVHAMAKAGTASFIDSLFTALHQIQGAYSLLVMNPSEMYAVRDPQGFRPLCMGIMEPAQGQEKPAYIFASETCALDIMGASYERDVEPGEVVHIRGDQIESFYPWKRSRYSFNADTGKHEQAEEPKQSLCIFEFIYFSRPDSKIFNQSVYKVRKALGAALAKEHPVEADVVIAVPDSSNVAAIGYAEHAGIPFENGLIRSHYIGRTFIEPDQKIRDFGAKLKYNAIEEVLKDKRVVVVDDSIMRGTTSKKIIKMLRQAGAKEIHMRISAPPTKYPCYYGIDIPTKSELIAANHNLEEIRTYLRVDSIQYMSIDAMVEAAGSPDNWCLACFNGKYPLEFIDGSEEKQKSLFDSFISSEN